MKVKLILLFAVCFAQGTLLEAQTKDFNMVADKTEVETYVWPEDPKVKANLATWQGEKFGLLIHMGLYSELGTIESWGLCPEDWVGRPGYDDYYKYASDYRNTKLKFNPVNFDPQKWAKMFKGSGAKYMIYSSKHHDGFCLYDSKYTDFKVTDNDCPFSTNPKSNILKEVLDATRKEGLGVGIYYSKPDWSSQNFWWSYYPPKDRNPTYDITKFPERWKGFVEYTQNQINELTTEYGKIDMLWLDGCWVLPKASITKRIEEYCKYPYDMDINMKLIAEKAREKQPGMLVVDRWVAGEYENYLTPEQKMPEKALSVPWESCITMGDAWGWVPNDNYKSSKQIVQLLVNIVAKGGNLLLGIGPDGKGVYDPKVIENLAKVGKWLETNGEAIYETKPVEPYLEGKVGYTAKGDNVVYAIYMPAKDEMEIPSLINVKTKLKGNIKVSLVASNQKLNFKNKGGEIAISIPQSLLKTLIKQEAVVIKISK
jgi:alpha-L-fucosidase